MVNKKNEQTTAQSLGIEVNGVQEGIDFKVDVNETSEIDKVFDEYVRNDMAIAKLKEANNLLKPTLTELVLQEENKAYIRNGLKAQMVTVKPSKALKTRAEVLAVVPKRYHCQILKDKLGNTHLKVGTAPKTNTVTDVTITEG